MNITTLGSSSAGNCYIIDDGKTRLLLDAGVPFSDIQRATDYRVNEISGCLISHRHGDHTKSIPQLVRRGVGVFGPEDVAEHFQGVRNLEEFTPVGVGTYDVVPFGLEHDAPCFGYQVRSIFDGSCLVYITDSSGCDVRFKGCNYLLIEANHDWSLLRQRVDAQEIPETLARRIENTHMSIRQVEEFLRDMDRTELREVRLIHLSDDNSSENDFISRVEAIVGAGVKVTAEG